jgi:aspartate aminotransferase-like enzyme
VGGGYGEWKDSTFRIGHMGEVRDGDLEALLAATDGILDGVPFRPARQTEDGVPAGAAPAATP